MRKSQIIHLLYSILITIGIPFFLLRLMWKSRKNTSYRKRLYERIAINLNINKNCIWIHTVSVGEFLATIPVIELLIKQNKNILVTTTTPTGSEIIINKLGNKVQHCYMPFDSPILAKVFIEKTQPSLAVFIETEIWPNYINQLNKKKIKSIIINARLSEKSYNGYITLKEFSKQTIKKISLVACQDKISENRFKKLGAKTTTIGNMKFDINPPKNLEQKTNKLKKTLREPFILAASTHKGEESIILDAFMNSSYIKSHQLIIAPRHPERSIEIAKLCKDKKLTHSYLSNNQQGHNYEKKIIIINSIGEVIYLYNLADFAIIGGSFIKHGGHNPLEAALFSTPCIIGKNYYNFNSLVKKMNKEKAIIISNIEDLFKKREYLSSIGRNANIFLQENQGSSDKYKEIILKYNKEPKN